MITLRTREEVHIKAGGFADDVHVLCRADDESVKGIFRQYERLTKKSGLELMQKKLKYCLCTLMSQESMMSSIVEQMLHSLL